MLISKLFIEIILLIIVIITYVYATIITTRYFMHMLQLSSYQLPGFFARLRENKSKFFYPFVAGLASALYTIMIAKYIWNVIGTIQSQGNVNDVESYPYMPILAVFQFIFLIREIKEAKEKKKFVITDRIKRLIATFIILFIIVSIIGVILFLNNDFIAPGVLSGILFGVFIALNAFVVALCNVINAPIEKKGQLYYINDAKRILSEHGNLRIIGVTGSYGKTSVKFYLGTLLSEKYSVLITPESYNTPMGVVRTIRENLTPLHEVFVCEMGARHVGDIKEICDIVNPDDGIVTSIGPQHLETFFTMDNIVKTKYELLDAVNTKSDGVMYVNYESEFIRENEAYPGAIKYGFSDECDYRGEILSVTSNGCEFKLETKSGESEVFTTHLVGAHNVQNLLGAIAIANNMGIELSKLKNAVRRIKAVPHRLELTRHGDVTILDDAFNSNPVGAKAALDTLKMFDNAYKILVTPGMVELGEDQDIYNEEFGRQAAEVCDHIILVGLKQAPPIQKGIIEAGFDEDKLQIAATFDEAASMMYAVNTPGERVILIENDLPDNYI